MTEIVTQKVADITPRMMKAEWMAEGERRFGPDYFHWKFVCPICGNVSEVSQYKDAGASDPNSAYQNCIGRFTGTKNKAFPSEGEKRGKPCNYALYGLLRLPGVIVIDEDHENRETLAFAFAEVKP